MSDSPRGGWKLYADNAIVEIQRALTSDETDALYFLKQALQEIQIAITAEEMKL